MATTTPDNLRSPNPTDPYNLVSDWAISMNDVQAAFTLRDGQRNAFRGTTAERNAFTSSGLAFEGMTWYDTTNNTEYVRSGGAWTTLVTVTVTGDPSGTLAPGQNWTQTIPFGVTFDSPPMVSLTGATSAAIPLWFGAVLTTQAVVRGRNIGNSDTSSGAVTILAQGWVTS